MLGKSTWFLQKAILPYQSTGMLSGDQQKHMDKSDPIDVVYLDFQKACDMVPHQRLSNKVNSHGVRWGVIMAGLVIL